MSVWDKMQRSQEAEMIRREERASLAELADKSDRMALAITAGEGLLDEVSRNLGVLLLGDEKQQEALGAEIAERNLDAIPEVVEDKRERAALVIAIARRIENIRKRTH